MKSTPGRVAPPAEEPQLTEHVNILMTEETRAFLLGCMLADGARSVSAVARALLQDAIDQYADRAGITEYTRRIKLGRRELARRAASAS